VSKWFVVLNPAKIIILIAFIISLYKLDRKNYVENRIFIIILLALINEVFTSFLYFNDISIGLLTTVYITLNIILWLHLLSYVFQNKNTQYLIIGFITFSIVNLLLFEGTTRFNYSTFIFGSIIYLGVFLWESYQLIIKEQLDFFTSKPYLFLIAPIFNFVGLSLIFSFKTKQLTSLIVFENITLFMLISYTVNYLYYGVLMYAMFKKVK
jgi:hypothetical protein